MEQKTIDKHLVFMAFIVNNSVGKRLENAAFARSGKLSENVQENKVYTSVLVDHENNRQTSCFHGNSVGKCLENATFTCSSKI